MAALDRMRGPLALLAVVPLALVGLTGCASGSDGDETETTAPTSEAGGGSGGGGLPFPEFPDTGGENDGTGGDSGGSGGETAGTGETGDAGGASGDGSGDAGGGSGAGSGGDKVAYGDTDLSSVDWEVFCTAGASPSIIGGESGSTTTGDETGPVLWITTDEAGKVDFVMISPGGDGSTSMLYWSSSSGSGSATLAIAGQRATASGTAFEMADYSNSTPIDFTIDVACDTTM